MRHNEKPERNKLITAAVAANERTCREIGHEFGITPERVRQIALRDGVRPIRKDGRRVTLDEQARFAELWRTGGFSITEIARQTGRSKYCVNGALRRAAVIVGKLINYDATKNIAWGDEHDRILRDLWGNTRAASIAKRIGVTKNAVIGRARRIGLPRFDSGIRP